MHSPDLDPTPPPSVTSRPHPFEHRAEAASPAPSRPRHTVRLTADRTDAVVMLATAVLVVAGAVLESATESTGLWLALAGVALAVVLVARAFRGGFVGRG